MYTSCHKCKKLFQGDNCQCGWLKPKEKNRDNLSSYEKRYYERLEKKTGMDKVKQEAPRIENGDSKKDISNFWIDKIKKRIKNPKIE